MIIHKTHSVGETLEKGTWRATKYHLFGVRVRPQTNLALYQKAR